MKAVLCKSLDGGRAGSGGTARTSARQGQGCHPRFGGFAELFRHADGARQIPEPPRTAILARQQVAGTIAANRPPWRLAVRQRMLAYTAIIATETRDAAAVDTIPLPDGIADEAAAAIPIAYGTALHGLEDRGHVSAGQTVLISARPAARASRRSRSQCGLGAHADGRLIGRKAPTL